MYNRAGYSCPIDGSMIHDDRFEASGLSLSNLSEGQCFAFAVCVRVEFHPPVCKHPASVFHPVHAWLIASRKKTGRETVTVSRSA